MGLLNRVAEALRVLGGAEVKTAGSQSSWQALFAAGFDSFSARETVALNEPFRQHPTVHAAVSAISGGISGLPIEMFPEGTDEEDSETPVEDSVVLRLLDEPNPDMDGAQLIEGTIDFMKLEGDAFWFLDRMARRTASGPQFPTRIELWEPSNVRAVMAGREVTAWDYRDGTFTYRAPAASVIQFKQFNPYDRIRGLAPLDAAMIAAKGGYTALVWNNAFLRNNAVPPMIITPKENAIIKPESLERLRDQLTERHAGAGKQGQIGAVAAALDFHQLGFNQKDMDFGMWLDTTSAFILMVFKVPPSVAGVQKDANYNESIHQSKQFWYHHMPLVKYIERRIRMGLCKRFGIPEMPFFKTESIKALIEDQESLSNQARNYFNMGVPFDDINERLELGFETGGHVSMETSWLPFSMVNADEQAVAPASSATGGPAASPGTGPQNQPGDMPTQDEPGAGMGATARPALVKSVTSREVFRAMNWKTLISQIRNEEMAFNRRLRDHFNELRGEVLRKLKSRRSVKADDSPAIFQIDSVVFDKDEAAADIRRRTDPIYKSAAQQGIDSVVRELNLDSSFELLTEEVMDFLRRKRIEIPDLVDTPAMERLRAALQEGLIKGESVDKIADRVSQVFEVERSRAERIARTETAQSFNGGRYETLKAAGVEQIEWLSARDNRVRDSHVEMDGDVINVGGTFKNGLRYPLDPSGPPEEVVNCFVPGTIIEGWVVAGLRTNYVGPIIEIVTRAGHRLSVTPNHPILTPDGLVAAKSLREGGYLLSKDTERERQVSAGIVDDHYDGPTVIEQVFDTFRSKGGLSPREIGASDFHGDARFMNGYIDVVVPDRILLDRAKAIIEQRDGEGILVGAAVGKAKISGYRPSLPSALRIDCATSGSPGSGALPLNRNSILLDPGPFDALRLGPISKYESPSLEPARQNATLYPTFLSELINAHSGLVTVDKILSVTVREHSGVVYDVQGAHGWIVAQNIFSSNCRCVALSAA